jgi:hypothetical protein
MSLSKFLSKKLLNIWVCRMSNLIYKKMSHVMAEIGHVGKDQKNQAQGFKFRGIDQFVNALYPALTKHGVFMAPRCVSNNQEIKEVERSSGKKGIDKHVTLMMEYDFFAEDGSKVTVGPIPSEGLDSGDKATNKALSAGLKYALIQTFSIPTEDMEEADRSSPEKGATIRSGLSQTAIGNGNVQTVSASPAKEASGDSQKNEAKTDAPAKSGSRSFRTAKPATATEEL